MNELNIRAKTTELLEENIWVNLQNFGWIWQWLLRYDSKSMSNTTSKTDKLDFIKIKQFAYQRTLSRKEKDNLKKWEKIFANYVSDKGLVSRIYKELQQIINKKTTQLKNGQRTWTDIFPKKIYKQPISI